jgi:hypothetical protein
MSQASFVADLCRGVQQPRVRALKEGTGRCRTESAWFPGRSSAQPWMISISRSCSAMQTATDLLCWVLVESLISNSDARVCRIRSSLEYPFSPEDADSRSRRGFCGLLPGDHPGLSRPCGTRARVDRDWQQSSRTAESGECTTPNRSGILRLRGMRRMLPRLTRLRSQICRSMSEQLRTRVGRRFGGWKSPTITGRELIFGTQWLAIEDDLLISYFPATVASSACMLRNRPVSPS